MTGKLMVLTALVLMAALAPVAALADKAEAPAAEKMAPQPRAYFENLKDGDTVTSPFKVKFGISGMDVKPAGDPTPNSGHFHLLIDSELTAEQLKSAIPNDDNHKHFGKGQTETDLTLPAGKHTLQLFMGDKDHVPHNPPVMSDKITVTVK